jgi:hypothetical protein
MEKLQYIWELSNVFLWHTFKVYLAVHTDGTLIVRLSNPELTAVTGHYAAMTQSVLQSTVQWQNVLSILFIKCLMIHFTITTFWLLRLVQWALSALCAECRVLIYCVINAVRIKWHCQYQQPQNESTSISLTTTWMPNKQQVMANVWCNHVINPYPANVKNMVST